MQEKIIHKNQRGNGKNGYLEERKSLNQSGERWKLDERRS